MNKVIALAAAVITLFVADQASAQFGIRIGTRPTVGTHVVIGSVPGVHVGTSRPMSSSKLRLGSNLYGQWTVNANHVNASLDLQRSGYSMDTGQVYEEGVWDGDPNGFNQFTLSLKSSLRGETRFNATWTVVGQQFRMTSVNSGVSYLVTRNQPVGFANTPSGPIPGVVASVSQPSAASGSFGSGTQSIPNRTHYGLQ